MTEQTTDTPVKKFDRPAVGFHRETLENVLEKSVQHVFDPREFTVAENGDMWRYEDSVKVVQLPSGTVYLIPPKILAMVMYYAYGSMKVLDRAVCEKNHTHVHLITYLQVKACHGDGPQGVVSYRRTGNSVKDLMDRYSVGVGGHVEDLEGYEQPSDIWQCIWRYAKGEVSEEIGIEVENSQKPHYLNYWGIYDPSSEVGRHHLGLLTTIDMGQTQLGDIESQLDSIEVLPDDKFDQFFDLLDTRNWEPWSQAALFLNYANRKCASES